LIPETILKEIREMSRSLDALKDEVRQNRDAVASAVSLINGIAQRIESASDDGELDALTADLRQQASDLAGAVAANTPAATPVGTGAPASTADQSGSASSAAGKPATNPPDQGGDTTTQPGGG
jgi:hypothetical protein